MEKNVWSGKRFVVTMFCLLVVMMACFVLGKGSMKAALGNASEENVSAFYFTSPWMPEMLTFAGDTVPLDRYWVRESLERELLTVQNQHTLTMLSMKRSGRYFPEIESIMKEEGLPDDFKYLCVAESNLQNVVSSAKAAGFWQFMEATAKLYGLEVREEVDERYNLEKATHAACRYLKGSKSRLGSWAIAAAAYNMGEAGVKRNMNDQSCNSYWDLYLNRETARYMYRILAYKLVFENPEKYHFRLFPQDYYAPIAYDTLSVNASVGSLHEFARSQNVTYRELKAFNPWLRTKTLTLKGQTYVLKLPKKS